MASAAAAISFLPAFRAVTRAIRVLTVDGHQLVQEGLADMINREEDMTVVAAASTGEEALDAVRRYRPDVVRLDLLLPDMPGEDLARRILAGFPRTRIVAITSAQGHLQARRALDAGVHGYLSKAVPVCELVRTIRQEIQVLRLFAWGNGNKQVAAQLSIACETVRMHIKSILEKLAANDRAHAVTIAVMRGLLRLDWTNDREAYRRTAHA